MEDIVGGYTRRNAGVKTDKHRPRRDIFRSLFNFVVDIFQGSVPLPSPPGVHSATCTCYLCHADCSVSDTGACPLSRPLQVRSRTSSGVPARAHTEAERVIGERLRLHALRELEKVLPVRAEPLKHAAVPRLLDVRL